MVRFDPGKYRYQLESGKKKLSQRARELKIKIGQEEGAAQSWSRPAQKAMEQDLEVVLAQLEVVEQKARELESLLKKRETLKDKVSLGSTVTVKVGGEEEVFMILSFGDPQFGVLSKKSPVGQALIGKRKGEKARIVTSGVASEWEILKVE